MGEISDDEEEKNKLIQYSGGENSENKEQERDMDRGNSEDPTLPRYCCCCSDRVCIWIGWIIFVIILGIFIFAMVFKYRNDNSENN